MTGPLVILSGPSGSGKSTIIDRLLQAREWPLRLSVSVTTRDPRKDDIDGVHYHFWTRERFQEEIAAGGFLEWADVFGNYYGTPRSEVEPYRRLGMGVILDIDVQGAAQVRAQCPDASSIFVYPSSLDALRDRLTKRGTETLSNIIRRMEGAQGEMARMHEYQHCILNDDLELAIAKVREVFRQLFANPVSKDK